MKDEIIPAVKGWGMKIEEKLIFFAYEGRSMNPVITSS
jgi:hypothetical protein